MDHVATEQVRGHADSDLTVNIMHCFSVYLEVSTYKLSVNFYFFFLNNEDAVVAELFQKCLSKKTTLCLFVP